MFSIRLKEKNEKQFKQNNSYICFLEIAQKGDLTYTTFALVLTDILIFRFFWENEIFDSSYVKCYISYVN